LADRRGWQVRQQLSQISLRIDVVPAAGAGEAAQDRCRLTASLVPDK
jgi:hypothetical protein